MKSARGAIAIPAMVTTLETFFGTSLHHREDLSHELLHTLLQQKTTVAATPLVESTPSENLRTPNLPL